MGQYHLPVCPELHEFIAPRKIGCGMKMWEHIFNTSTTCDALVILLANFETPSQSPGDVYLAGVSGRWAGKSAFYLGDYAADGDLRKWACDVPESDLYGFLHADDDDDDDTKLQRSSYRPFVDLSQHVRPGLEICSGMVFSEVVEPWTVQRQDGTVSRYETLEVDQWRVRRTDHGGWTIDLPPGLNDYYLNKAKKALSIIEARTDIHFLNPDEMDAGQARLIVNLDKREYFDPVEFGEVPTIAGLLHANSLPKSKETGTHEWISTKAWTSIQALASMLFFSETRGGGDISAGIVGRWRGDRIVVLGDNPTEAYPGHEEIRRDYANIGAIATQSVEDSDDQ